MTETPLQRPPSKTELVRAHYQMQHGLFVSEVRARDGLISAYSRMAPGPMWNHIAWVEPSENALSELEQEARQFNEHDRRPTIYLVQEEQGKVAEALAARGFEPFDREAWMVWEPSASRARTAPELRVVEARTETEVSDFVSVFYHAFRITEPGYALALQRSGPGNDREIRHFVAYAGTEPVCGGTLIQTGSLACLYNVGTVPTARGRGYAAQVMDALIDAASHAGAATIFLQVEQKSGAEALYRRLGFKTAFTRIGYQLKKWQPRGVRGAATAVVPPLASLLGASAQLAGETAASSKQTATIPLEIAAKLKSKSAAAGASPEAFFATALATLLMRYFGEETASFAVQWADGKTADYQIALDLQTPAATAVAEIGRQLASAQSKSSSVAAPQHEILLAFGHGHQPAAAPLQVGCCLEPSAALEISYQSHLYEKDEVRRLGMHLIRAIEGLLRTPSVPLAKLELITASERQQMLVDWNPHESGLFQGADVVGMFEAQVERTPHAIALTLAAPGRMDAPEQLTYRQLNRRANQLAHALKKSGVTREAMVGICLERSLNMIVSLIAVWKAGGVAVPLDPAYPQDRLNYMIEDSRARVILTQQKLAWLFPAAGVRAIKVDEESAAIAQENEKNLGVTIACDSAAYVIYTSGSTGKPKGVVIEHLALAAHSRDAQKHYGLSVHDVVLQFSSFNFDAALEQIVPALITGANLVLRDNEVWSTRQFAECLEKIGLTIADIPTAYWAQLAREWAEAPETIPPNRLRLVIVGGEALPPRAHAFWRQTPMANVRLVNAYGPTETTITATAYDVPESFGAQDSPRSVPIGRPRGGREIYVLDRWLNPTPLNVPGELHIGGRMLARGYLNRPELTTEKFISSPFTDDPAARLYKTGDLVRYLPDGNLEFLGRLDDQVKIRGFRIELGEIEAALRSHPQVKEAVVLAREDHPGDKRLVAYYTATNNSVTQAELRRHVRGSLPEYMAPSAFVRMDALPLLPSGKINRRALPAPTAEAEDDADQIKRPSDPLELQLKLVFERVLKRSRVGVDVSFFELGGDSLQALELLVEIEKATGRTLPLGALYQSATIEGLAEIIRREPENAEFKCLVPLQAGGSKPPLYFVHTTPGDVLGYGSLIYHLGSDQPCYGFQSLGLGDPSKSHTDICEMAAHYTQLLKQHQPQGPYYLAGWCYGGVVALEMARLLKEQGDEVALLALFETVAMRPSYLNALYYLHRLACMLSMSPTRWATYIREKIRYRRESVIANRMRFRQIERRPDEDPVAAEQTERRLAHLERIYNTNLEALNHYRPKYYHGKVTLFNAQEQDPALLPDPDYGWVGLASKIEVHMVPGGHDTMLAEPNVSALAHKLAATIAQAQKSFSSRNTP
ncbi:MAG TPA: amino acid adenylation domain-containing protein [Methylomirabilota bacterium]|nr:amino acid adenylation domain-containing protein [Methylomirabilota bacterium]